MDKCSQDKYCLDKCHWGGPKHLTSTSIDVYRSVLPSTMYAKFAIFKLFRSVVVVVVGNTLILKPASFAELGNKPYFN